MNIRYQVFVSSTFRDLKDERKLVIDELNKVGFIAIGMENFPASDEEQMEYIRPLIDESDYYIVIVKSKYGSCILTDLVTLRKSLITLFKAERHR